MKIVSLEEAKTAKLKVYYTGTPCGRGHLAPRFTSSRGCTVCSKENQQRWCAENPEAKRALGKQWQDNNPEKVKKFSQQYEQTHRVERQESARAYRKACPEKVAQSTKAWRLKNPAVVAAHVANRRVLKLQATPANLTTQVFTPTYETCQAISQETGIPHEVDHIVPLKHPAVCGLHVPWNLQIIPAKENRQKKNKFLIDISND